MSNKVAPCGDRVVVRQAGAERTTKSGIIIPDTAQDKPQQGEVIAVGDGEELAKIGIAVGDVVLYSKYGGIDVTVGGEELLILKAADVMAKIV